MIDYKSSRKLGGSEMGNIAIDANTTVQAGKIAAYSATGTATVATSASIPVGVFKWNKASTLYGVAVKEAVTISALETAYSLSHAIVSNVLVEDADGTDYTVGASNDYTVGATNGTITATASGTTTISAGETVYVTYTYQKSAADIDSEDGKNFFNTNDDTAGSGKMVLYQGNWRIYTDQFDTSQNYAINDQLYVDNNGQFSTSSLLSAGKKFGKVVSVPTASSPMLGIEGNFSIDANAGN